MFSIFTYIMSRVTHSKPGLPRVTCVIKLAMAKLTFFREAGNSRDSAKILQFSRPYAMNSFTVLL